MTKLNEKARIDIEEDCRYPELKSQILRDGHWSKPKVSYTLNYVQI